MNHQAFGATLFEWRRNAYVGTKEMPQSAQSGGCAACALNTENMDMAQAALAAGMALSASVIMQTTPGILKYAGKG